MTSSSSWMRVAGDLPGRDAAEQARRVEGDRVRRLRRHATGRSTSSTTQSVWCSRSDDMQAHLLERRDDLGLAVDEDARRQETATRPDRGRERRRQLDQQRGDEVGEHQVEGPPLAPLHGVDRHRATGRADAPGEPVAAHVGDGRVDRDGIGVDAQHGAGSEASRGDGQDARAAANVEHRAHLPRALRRPSARCPPGTGGSWDGGRCRRPCPGRGPAPRHPARHGDAATSAG